MSGQLAQTEHSPESKDEPSGMMGHDRMTGCHMMGHRGMMGGVGMRIIFALMDSDSDGTVSLQEIQPAHERIFKQWTRIRTARYARRDPALYAWRPQTCSERYDGR